MKYIIFIFLSAVSFPLMGQDSLNGSFEDWGYDPFSFPLCRSWFWGIFNTPCGPYNEVTEKTDDSFHGSWAIKMESQVCSSSSGLRLRTGRARTTDTENPLATQPLGWSVEYSERPEELSFHYKFHQEGTDSAAVYLLLFNYDIDTHTVDTIAITSDYIHEETTEYTELTLPIEYLRMIHRLSSIFFLLLVRL